MWRPFLLATCCLLGLLPGASVTPARAQSADEVRKLKEQLELLQGKYDLLQKENELLKKEIELLKKGGGGHAAGDAGPKATVGDVEYVVERVSRSGNTVTLSVTATNGGADRTMTFTSIEGVDADGKTYRTQLRENPRSLQAKTAKLAEGVKTKLQFSLEGVPSRVTELARVEIHTGRSGTLGSGGETIRLRNVRLEK